MPRYITKIATDIGRDQVFSDLSRFDRAAEWDPGVDEGTMLTPEPVGARIALRAARPVPRADLALEYEIVAFEPTPRVVLRAENSVRRSIDTITFEPRGRDATVVTYDARLEPKGVGPARRSAARARLSPHRRPRRGRAASASARGAVR